MKDSVWDTEIGSRLGRYDTKDEALAFVRAMIAIYGREKVGDLSLDWCDEQGVGMEMIGDDLLDRAAEMAPTWEKVGVRSELSGLIASSL